jgi:adenylate cyclase
MIAEYRRGELSLRDGNTRYGAMRLLGWPTCWVIVWYNSESDYQRHNKALFGRQAIQESL